MIKRYGRNSGPDISCAVQAPSRRAAWGSNFVAKQYSFGLQCGLKAQMMLTLPGKHCSLSNVYGENNLEDCSSCQAHTYNKLQKHLIDILATDLHLKFYWKAASSLEREDHGTKSRNLWKERREDDSCDTRDMQICDFGHKLACTSSDLHSNLNVWVASQSERHLQAAPVSFVHWTQLTSRSCGGVM